MEKYIKEELIEKIRKDCEYVANENAKNNFIQEFSDAFNCHIQQLNDNDENFEEFEYEISEDLLKHSSLLTYSKERVIADILDIDEEEADEIIKEFENEIDDILFNEYETFFCDAIESIINDDYSDSYDVLVDNNIIILSNLEEEEEEE